MSRLITLTTDFGARDPYVASLKGVLFSSCPDAQIIDLSHDIAPQDIMEGALFLAGAVPFFPKDTIHIVVVDPGVGSGRHPVAVRAGDHYFVCPDNGLLTFIVRTFAFQEARIISNPDFMLDHVSETFHGRDIFAPAAAGLANGAALSELGDELDQITMLHVASPTKDENDVIHGQIIHVDRFGNLITNIPRSLLGDSEYSRVKVGGTKIKGLHKTYGEVPEGATLALFGSSDHLEVAVSQGDACKVLGLGKGDEVTIAT